MDQLQLFIKECIFELVVCFFFKFVMGNEQQSQSYNSHQIFLVELLIVICSHQSVYFYFQLPKAKLCFSVLFISVEDYLYQRQVAFIKKLFAQNIALKTSVEENDSVEVVFKVLMVEINKKDTTQSNLTSSWCYA